MKTIELSEREARLYREDVPLEPSTAILHGMHPIEPEAQAHNTELRALVREVNSGQREDLIGITGSCSPRYENEHILEDSEIIDNEIEEIKKLGNVDGLLPFYRMVVHKFRTDPKRSWKGLEKTNPLQAYEYQHRVVNRSAGLATEFGKPYHVPRYAHMPAVVWFGARLDEQELDTIVEDLVVAQPDITIGLKGPVSGEIEQPIEKVRKINEQHADIGRVAFFMYRGGENARNASEWEDMYKRAYDLTEGRFGVDVAHGTERAHHPEFDRSREGQIEALEHLIRLSEDEGLRPMAVMIEGSDIKSPIDPNMPFDIAKDGLVRLAKIAA